MKKVLIANRGEIARRVIRTCRLLGIQTVALASEADQYAPHVTEADAFALIGPSASSESYLRIDRVIQAAKEHGVDGIHPGYGFLSENAEFSQAVEDAGMLFIGPKPETIMLMGSKQESKIHMKNAGVPVIPGYQGGRQDADFLKEEAESIGYPVLIKASAGGGGKGMRVVRESGSFHKELEAAKREALNAFSDDLVILEKYIENPRHIEFQVFGDGKGGAVHLFERECSIQRRHQKIIEETPSPALTPELRKKMADAACLATSSVNYKNAGTVEFILDPDQNFYFLEMNTRLQVEHPVTEMITGIDLVRWQLYIAEFGEFPAQQSEIKRHGHSFEARIYAEDPENNFFPQTGVISKYREPCGSFTRMDSGVIEGSEVSVYYDPMLAKLITYGATREEAREKMIFALAQTCVHGVKTNLSFLKTIFQEERFCSGEVTTAYLEEVFPEFQTNDALIDEALALSLLQSHKSRSGGRNLEALDGPWQALGSWRSGQ